MKWSNGEFGPNYWKRIWAGKNEMCLIPEPMEEKEMWEKIGKFMIEMERKYDVTWITDDSSNSMYKINGCLEKYCGHHIECVDIDDKFEPFRDARKYIHAQYNMNVNDGCANYMKYQWKIIQEISDAEKKERYKKAIRIVLIFGVALWLMRK